MPEDRSLFRKLLAGREARAWAQKFILGVDGVSCVVQISLNVPGLPKNIPGDMEAVATARRFFLRELGAKPSFRAVLRDGAGIAEIFPFAMDASDVKKTAIETEDGHEWGRALDIDVINETGALSRESFGERPRTCLLCEKPAKICAREANHGRGDLRAEVIRLLDLARSESRYP
ncbi:MAG: citrate lyase holo-[acyl-carrier protein] synthase [Synergistaceae bacterium]|jgi:holo-ACP synthase CitX|nr:citrate lyase holo-[acyl-carrier protein] synthase [Synergistaceae bacterium]